MPIYAYRCEACGFAKDALQKMSDAPLTVCPSCGQATFKKQVTAAGFQLKGSGWYVTDFRGGDSGGAAKADADGAKTVVPPPSGDASAATGAAAPASTAASTPAAAHAAPAAASSGPSSSSSSTPASGTPKSGAA